MNPELLNALKTGDIKALEELLGRGISIKQTASEGTTPLLVAAAFGHIPMVETLLKNKYSQITEKDNYGDTALLVAAAFGQIPMVEYLLKNKLGKLTEKNTADGDNVLSLAAWNGHVDTVSFLLKQGAYINLPLTDGRTALR